jgi:hypothetical protein
VSQEDPGEAERARVGWPRSWLLRSVHHPHPPRALRVFHPFAAALERSALFVPFQRALANDACCSLVTRFIRFFPPFRPIAARYARMFLSIAMPRIVPCG